MPTVNSIISDVITREGGLETNPADKGGPTIYGISQKNNPEAWKNGPPTEAEARAIFFNKYVKGPGFEQITDPALQAQLVDFGINSGPALAIMKLQGVLGVTADGVLGPGTLAALAKTHPEDTSVALAKARVLMLCRIVQKKPSQLQFLEGWVDRALSFIV